MIAHVAERGEGRGRVVLQLGPSAALSETAVAAALRVAEAYQSEVEALFVEDRQLIDLASFPFAREIAFSGRTTRSLSVDDVARDMGHLATALQRRVLSLAHKSEIVCRCRTVRDDRVAALAAACAESGPWNVVTLAEPVSRLGPPPLGRLFEEVAGTTGIVIAGEGSRRTAGPVIAVVEEVERVPTMQRTAERLASVTGGDARLLLLARSDDEAAWMEGQARLVLGPAGPPLLSAVTDRDPARVVVETLRQVGAGFAIVRFGGGVAAAEEELARLAADLEGPVMLVR